MEFFLSSSSVSHAGNFAADTLAILSVAEDVSPTVGAPPYADLTYVVEANKAIAEEHRKLLQKYGQWCKTHNIDATLLLGHGYPRSVIVDEATKRNADIVVIGRRGMGALKRAFMGSHSRYVLEHCPCTVVVVNEQEE